ncbi:MAG: helix-turn-helix domain-containing protein [Alphaproteobacteria bacterium]|nr:helix-turn-helix domain-containing protein [Alphaproteobacteria bacterium]
MKSEPAIAVPDGIDADPILRTSEAASYLRVTPRYLEKLRTLGGGPVFLRLGAAAIRYRKSALDQWCEQRARVSTSDQGA